MFLKELNKEESIAFVNLVSQFANADKQFKKEEKKLIDNYLKELNLNKEDIRELSLEEELNTLKSSTDRVKRIIYFELVGLALVDGSYEDSEIDFLEKIAEEFSIARAKKFAIANYFYNVADDIYSFSKVISSDKANLLKEQAEKIIT